MTAPTGVPETGARTAVDPCHDPCCSFFGAPMSCEEFRRTHDVEGPCCEHWPADATAVVPTPPESAPTSSAQGDEGGAGSPTSAPPATPH